MDVKIGKIFPKREMVWIDDMVKERLALAGAVTADDNNRKDHDDYFGLNADFMSILV